MSESNEGGCEDWLDLGNGVRTNKAQIQKSLCHGIITKDLQHTNSERYLYKSGRYEEMNGI